jgi:hypothetical protein
MTALGKTAIIRQKLRCLLLGLHPTQVERLLHVVTTDLSGLIVYGTPDWKFVFRDRLKYTQN